MTQLDRALVNTINARNVAVAERIDAVYMSAAPTPPEKVLDFDAVLAVADQVVGRDAVFAALAAFRTNHDRGYFDLVAEAGLGKTALAAAIARRFDAICFFTSASRGLKRAEQFLTHASAALIVKYALNYPRLPENSGGDGAFLSKVLRDAAATVAAGQALWIVVDALDEAEPPPDEANPLLLPDELPRSVYVAVTRRPGRDLSTVANTPVEQYVIRRDDADQHASIDAYLRNQAQPASRVGQVLAALAAVTPAVSVEEFVTRLKAASEGNFMYLSYAIEDLANRQSNDAPLDLADLPRGLFGYYERFWSRLQEVKAQEGWAEWNGLYRPVIERLGVALEPVPAEWLATQIGRDTEEVTERALDRWQRLLGREQRDGIDGWRLVHRTFADFLNTKVDLGAAHLAVADSYAIGLSGNLASWDTYGLRHTITHYAEAAGRTKPLGHHPIVARMVALVTDSEFQKASLDQLADPTQVERDLELALACASHAQQPPSVSVLAEVALALVAFRHQERLPRPVFDLAQRGELVAAERRLDLFALDVDDDWHAALLLTIAWLGAARKPREARQLFDRVSANTSGSPTLILLAAHVGAALDGTAPPPVPLAPPAPLPVAEAIVARMSGSPYAMSMLGGFSPELLYQSDTTFYLAHQDGQPLVAFALVDPTQGEPLLRRYVQIHAAYGYRQYRSGSLWALLDAVLRHPRTDWVRGWVPVLGEAVLAPIRGDFQEGLELAALGQRARLADGDALATLDQRAAAALKATEDLLTGEARGQGDVWGTHKRRLAALAEALGHVPNRQAQAVELLTRALAIRFGFAGFTAPAALRLAEAASITMPGDALAIEGALVAAMTSARNINDPTFCARTTARVNAIHENWWRAPPAGRLDLRAAAVRLSNDSTASEFAARHHVGEDYVGRDPYRTVPLPQSVLRAATLEQLATVYERPLDDFVRLNAGLAVDQPLPPGAVVNVPDPGFAPFIATYLSAHALVDPSLSDAERAGVIQVLVPVASADVTALDTLLARMLLSFSGQDPAPLRRVQQLAAIGNAETPDYDSPPQGELTALPA